MCKTAYRLSTYLKRANHSPVWFSWSTITPPMFLHLSTKKINPLQFSDSLFYYFLNKAKQLHLKLYLLQT